MALEVASERSLFFFSKIILQVRFIDLGKMCSKCFGLLFIVPSLTTVLLPNIPNIVSMDVSILWWLSIEESCWLQQYNLSCLDIFGSSDFLKFQQVFNYFESSI
jgi:hypothetical protein